MPALNPVRAENLNPDVLVMQPAKQGVRHDAPDFENARNATLEADCFGDTMQQDSQRNAASRCSRSFCTGSCSKMASQVT